DMGYEHPVLVAATDGVGTKLEVAFALNNHHTVGIDLVAMSVNDLVCHGAKPLFFLDYMALGHLDMQVGEAIVGGVVEGCRQADCALLGGETAQMPSFYPRGRYDLAGFAVGIVEREKIITGKRISVGDVILALPSSGVHSNGFSLIHLILKEAGLDFSDKMDGKTVGEVLLTPTRIYVEQVLRTLDEGVSVHAIANVTGGGLPDNIGRLLREGLSASIDRSKWEVPGVFKAIMEWGGIEEKEMFDTYNMGVGMIYILPEDRVEKAIECNEGAFVIGRIEEGSGVTIK
ncbi:MAG: phosphoribosylformylglycinamidine cyclo-ligase, partial [bacterium]|nr:phosphoribosylformylglycinamidine cyclo-ligase [bacterium]